MTDEERLASEANSFHIMILGKLADEAADRGECGLEQGYRYMAVRGMWPSCRRRDPDPRCRIFSFEEELEEFEGWFWFIVNGDSTRYDREDEPTILQDYDNEGEWIEKDQDTERELLAFPTAFEAIKWMATEIGRKFTQSGSN